MFADPTVSVQKIDDMPMPVRRRRGQCRIAGDTLVIDLDPSETSDLLQQPTIDDCGSLGRCALEPERRAPAETETLNRLDSSLGSRRDNSPSHVLLFSVR